MPFEIPIDLASERFPRLPELKLRFFSFWLFGSLSWYMIGRVGEDILTWRRSGLPSSRRFDLFFGIEAFVLALLSLPALVLDRPREDFRVIIVWSAIWVVLASTALSLRLFQIAKGRQKMVSAA